MNPKILMIYILTIGFVLTTTSFANAQAYVYPSKGQSAEQQKRDEYECYQWARQQTGFDPMQQPQASAPPPQQQARQGGLLRGAARGATIGVVGGAMVGGAGAGRLTGFQAIFP